MHNFELAIQCLFVVYAAMEAVSVIDATARNFLLILVALRRFLAASDGSKRSLLGTSWLRAEGW
jgi:hypothetical protein